VYLPRFAWGDERPYQVLWQHAPLQDGRTGGLTEAAYPMYDQWVFVSQQQERSYIARQRVTPERSQVIANGIHPTVRGLFPDRERLWQAKAYPPGALRLLYASSPLKGLDVVAKIYPSFQAAFPGATLEVYSSSQGLYQSQAGDQLMASPRARLEHMPGVKVAGSLPPPDYAERLKQAHILLYPAYAQEDTCGIVVLEAMAAGCLVVTTGNGALSETAAVFGAIAHSPSPYKVPERFFQQLAQVAQRIQQQPEAYATFIAGQSAYIRHRHDWERVALTWEQQLIQALSARPARV
jgi:glycosyltransferase involved in cell wall biosynthesis